MRVIESNNAVWQSRETLLRNFTDCEEIDPYVKWRGAREGMSTLSGRNITGVDSGFLLPGINPDHGTGSVASLRVPLCACVQFCSQVDELTEARNVISAASVFSSVEWGF